MRTNIVINDELINDVMKSYQFKTKRQAVEEGLQALRRQAAYRKILALGGTVQWEGDLDSERSEWKDA